MSTKGRETRSVSRGLIAGSCGGLAGAWCMNQFQSAWSRVSKAVRSQKDEQSSEFAGGQSSQRQSDPATVQAAARLVHGVFGRDLTPKEKKVADPVMHYSFGTVTGAAYGIAAEVVPEAAAGAGLPFGAAVWLGADEIAVPALGLSKPAWESPLSTHVYALASHFVYGLTAELTRRSVR
ncbi:MAG TPA: DUF1440 domain-containing protein [Bryobacteraceae bacterium]|nr:DUF1440 domain-containing protein [Bryobacteraceae bacterium]